MTDLSESEVLQALRDDVPSLEECRLSGQPDWLEMYNDELTSLINRLRQEAYELGRNEERPRDAIDL